MGFSECTLSRVVGLRLEGNLVAKQFQRRIREDFREVKVDRVEECIDVQEKTPLKNL